MHQQTSIQLILHFVKDSQSIDMSGDVSSDAIRLERWLLHKLKYLHM